MKIIDIEKLMSELTLEEKACLLSGHKSWYTNKVSRVGLPAVILTDGPHGLRLRKADDKSTGLGQTEPSTCFPAACTTGASWNKDLLYKMGVAMGEECNYYGVSLILGPAVNIKRNPLCGRNFEYFSEDPCITGSLGAKLTLGIENMGVGTSAKHFACNNNEKNRYFGDSIVDERAYHEIYLKGFEQIVKEANPASLMCAYNRVNGQYASENDELLNKILRDDWGFKGLVMSDWGAVNDRVEGLRCGLDLEMPGDVGYNRQVIVDAVNDGSLSMEVVDTAVRRVLEMVKRGAEAEPKKEDKFLEHEALAKEISIDSAVLMKNEGRALPLDESKRYLVVGEMFEKMRYQGAGSSLINPYKLTTPKDAFNAHSIEYIYEKGYNVYSFIDDAALVDGAIKAAENVDTIIFFGGLSEYAESEGFDRETLSLPKNQLNLLDRLSALGKKIIFVMFGGCPVNTDFDRQTSALLNMYLPGEAGGEATYELLFGKANPSGRLPESWPDSYADVPFGGEFTKTTNDRYKESIFVGYRYYSSFNVPVKYPFGYGLSYTDFALSNMKLSRSKDTVSISVDVKNVGDRYGATVVELFVNAPKSDIVKPLRELRGFEKVYLAAGEGTTVTVDVPVDGLRYYIDGKWRLENGEYTFEICSDANSVLLSDRLSITDGENISANSIYTELYGGGKAKLLSMTDSDFDKLIGRDIPDPVIKTPYDLNTPLRSYTTIGGKVIYTLIDLAFELIYNFEQLGNSPNKETKVKNAYFSWKTIRTMSLRSICFASEGLLSHNLANVILAIANNNIFKALKLLFKSEKTLKLPD